MFHSYEFINNTTTDNNIVTSKARIPCRFVLPTFYNVQPNIGSIINIDVGAVGSFTTLTLDSALYTITSNFIAAINTLLIAHDANFSTSYNSDTMKLTITHATTNFEIEDGFIINNMLGYDIGAIDGTALTYISDNPVNLFPYNTLAVRFQGLNTINSVRDNKKGNNSYNYSIPLGNYNYYDKLIYQITAIEFDYLISNHKKPTPSDGEISIVISVVLSDYSLKVIDFNNNMVNVLFYEL